ncbi:MAG TPA: hypothetical protein VMN76_10005 [Acidobacteriota bacterium]|nr:hypothetical protein [Acidobacteriota bacterium]
MAWKILRTLFPRFGFTGRDRARLLNLITLISLDDFLSRGWVSWKGPPPSEKRLRFRKGSVELVDRSSGRVWFAREFDTGAVELALRQTEKILDHYRLGEDEKSALFTALPCVGLAALHPHLTWRRPPPFSELG